MGSAAHWPTSFQWEPPLRGLLWQSGDHVVEVINRGYLTTSFNINIGIR
jgi:hypothetical protein